MTTATQNGSEVDNPLHRLTPDQLEQIGREFDDLHEQVKSDLGDRDARYIRGIIDLQRRLALLGRALLVGSRARPAWAAGTATLSMAKILENMEIGHNVMHGQWDWMNDPVINSSAWDWDTASTARAWKHSHNYIHHTFTNIRGKDKDLGYEIMRIDPHQPWHPVYLLQPLYNLLLMGLFEWGVAVHDMDIEAVRAGEKPLSEVWKDLKGISGKARDQIVKDYIGWPLVSATLVGLGTLALRSRELDLDLRARRPARGRRSRLRRTARGAWGRAKRRTFEDVATDALGAAATTFRSTAWADVVANLVRNVWSYSIIFCGHFPDQTYTFTEEETAEETRGARYVRQLIGAANIEGGPFFHVVSGNLGYQVEHHLYPDMPSTRYGEIAPRVRQICERYGLPYNTGPLSQQLGMVHRTIARLAFPGGKPRPKPGAYHGEKVRTRGERDDAMAATA